MTAKNEAALDLYSSLDEKAVQEAIANLIKGKTPPKAIKDRQGRGGGKVNYVETYYVVDQLNKVFGFKWDFEIVEHTVSDKCAIVKGKLTCHTPQGDIVKNQFGECDRQKNVPAGDTLKGAASDCLKKCASLIGIAIDVYWGKEVEFFADDEDDKEIKPDYTSNEAEKAFGRYVEKKKKTYSQVFMLLGIGSLNDITDYKEAYNKLVEVWGK